MAEAAGAALAGEGAEVDGSEGELSDAGGVLGEDEEELDPDLEEEEKGGHVPLGGPRWQRIPQVRAAVGAVALPI